MVSWASSDETPGLHLRLRHLVSGGGENRIIAETPGRWYVIRALLPLVLLAGILLYGVVTWVTGLLSR